MDLDLAHRRKIEKISAQLRAHRGPRPLSLRKKTVSHQVPKLGDLRRSDDKIDLGELNEILELDVAGRTCTAESGVTFVQLVAATLKHGLVPVVVPELKEITIGGAVAGCSIESTSFVHGGFHDSCLEYEVLTATGEVLHCSPENDALVFQMMHGAFGTLGILATLKFRLLPARPVVKVVYERYPGLPEYQEAIWRHFRRADVDFMDGIIHSPSELVLSTGRYVDRAPYLSRYDWMKVYPQSTRERGEDYLATPDYFFRYDHGVTQVHPKTALGRLLFGKLLGSSRVLRLAEQFPWLLPKKPHVILDVFLPFSRLADFMRWYRRELGFFPLWCVPYKLVHRYEWLAAGFPGAHPADLWVDLAIYGMKQTGERNVYRLIEEELRALGGIKTLISHNYYSEEEFWKIWNKDNYDRVKGRTDPQNLFRDLYAKTCRASMGLEAASDQPFR